MNLCRTSKGWWIIAAAFVAACGEPKPAASPPPASNTGVAPSVTPTLTREDRLALAQAVALPDGVLVRTAAGNLARYTTGLELVADAKVEPRVASIAVAGQQAYAVLRDGQVVRVSESLAIEPIATIEPGDPTWLDIHGDELLVFSVMPASHRARLDRIRIADRKITSIAISAGNSAASSIGQPSTFLLDRDRVWFGIDAGEWGGATGRVDLATNSVAMIEGDPEPVFGIVAAPNDRVWIYGGLIHMGATSGFISEIVGNKAIKRFTREAIGVEKERATNPAALPIVKVARRGTGLRILVWHELFDVSTDLATWTKVATLEAREHRGRPDAVGNYPATVSMIDVGGTTVLATVRDGLVILRSGKLAPASP